MGEPPRDDPKELSSRGDEEPKEEPPSPPACGPEYVRTKRRDSKGARTETVEELPLAQEATRRPSSAAADQAREQAAASAKANVGLNAEAVDDIGERVA